MGAACDHVEKIHRRVLYGLDETRQYSDAAEWLPKLEKVSINLAWTSAATYQNQRSLWFSARSGNKTIG